MQCAEPPCYRFVETVALFSHSRSRLAFNRRNSHPEKASLWTPFTPTLFEDMPYSPKQRRVTNSPRNTGYGSESPSQKSGIATSSTAAAMASPPDLAQQEWGLSA